MAEVTDETIMVCWWNDTNTGENPIPVQLSSSSSSSSS